MEYTNDEGMEVMVKVVIALTLAALAWFAIEATTPDECRVPADQMSAACKEMIYR